MQRTPQDDWEQAPSVASIQQSAFTLIPACFVANLSPEEFKARQQIYQVAYDKAREKLGSEADYGAISFDI